MAKQVKDNIGKIVKDSADSITKISKEGMAKINMKVNEEMKEFLRDLHQKEQESIDTAAKTNLR